MSHLHFLLTHPLHFAEQTPAGTYMCPLLFLVLEYGSKPSWGGLASVEFIHFCFWNKSLKNLRANDFPRLWNLELFPAYEIQKKYLHRYLEVYSWRKGGHRGELSMLLNAEYNVSSCKAPSFPSPSSPLPFFPFFLPSSLPSFLPSLLSFLLTRSLISSTHLLMSFYSPLPP